MRKIFQIFKYAENMYRLMEGLVRLEDSVRVVLPRFANIEDILPLAEIQAFSDFAKLSGMDKEKVVEHCLKVIDNMIDQPVNGHSKMVSVLLGRGSDSYLQLPPVALREVFPVLFYEFFKCDVVKTMRFMRDYLLLHNSGIMYDISTSFDGLAGCVKGYSPAAIGALKLHEYHDWFKILPKEEKKRMILNKGIIKQTIVDVMEPILAEVEKKDKGTKIIIYGPREAAKYAGYDAFRAIIEGQTFGRLEKKYGKHPQLDLRTDKSLSNVVEMMKKGSYS